MIKCLPAMQETWVRSLGQEDPLKEEMATHSCKSCLENPMDRGAWRAKVHGVTKSWTRLSDFTLVTEQQMVNQFLMIQWECNPLGFCDGQVIERGRGREDEGREKGFPWRSSG